MIRVQVRDSSPRGNPHDYRSVRLHVCAFALALGLTFASFASAQVLEGYVQLPDSFGPIHGPYHVAYDGRAGGERVFIGAEGGDVLVIDAADCTKLARIPTGPVGALCFSSRQNKLYVAPLNRDSVLVVDCGSYQVTARLWVNSGPYVTRLFYNSVVDRVYTGTSHIAVIDCDGDTILGMLTAFGTDACFALDSSRNMLYIGTTHDLQVLDCSSDSLVTNVHRVRGASVLCFNPTSDEVYAGAGDTLYTIDMTTDIIKARSPCPYQVSALACDPTHNRVYCAWYGYLAGIDCDANTIIWWRTFGGPAHDDMVSAPGHDKVYFANGTGWGAQLYSLDGATGGTLAYPMIGGRVTMTYRANPGRLYCISNDEQAVMVDCDTDTIAALVPLGVPSTYDACLDTVHDRLYFTHEGGRGYIGVVDLAAKAVERYIWSCNEPRGLVYNALNDRLYCTTNDGYTGTVSVIEGGSDSLVKVIPTDWIQNAGLLWDPTSNRIYAGTWGESEYDNLVIAIDCATDSVVWSRTRGTGLDVLVQAFLAPEFSQFWGISEKGYTVVDCLQDSIVMDTTIGFADDWRPWTACYSAAERKVYVSYGSFESGFHVLSMNSLRPLGDVPTGPSTYGYRLAVHVASVGKVYLTKPSPWPGADTILAVDTRTDSVVSSLESPCRYCLAVCADGTGRFLYFATSRETLLVIDTERDSIVSRTYVPDMTGTEADKWLLPNRLTGRIYMEPGKDDKIAVIRDSVVIGIDEQGLANGGPTLGPTLVNRIVPLRIAERAGLYDASGRRVVVLRQGLNDISRLAPGVYFVRPEPSAAGREPLAVTKVVVAR